MVGNKEYEFLKHFNYCLKQNDNEVGFSQWRKWLLEDNYPKRNVKLLIDYNENLKVSPLWMAVFKKKITSRPIPS